MREKTTDADGAAPAADAAPARAASPVEPSARTGQSATSPQQPDLLPDPVYFASLPKLTASAAVVLRDETGGFLAVKPNYRAHWLLPGGSLDPGEDPRTCARREVREELGLEIEIGRMLTVDWVPPNPARHIAMGLHFLFDGGVIPRADLHERIRLQASELDAWELLPEGEAHLLSWWGEQRLANALAVLRGEAEPDVH